MLSTVFSIRSGNHVSGVFLTVQLRVVVPVIEFAVWKLVRNLDWRLGTWCLHDLHEQV